MRNARLKVRRTCRAPLRVLGRAARDIRLSSYRRRETRAVHFLHIGKTGGNSLRNALGVKKDRLKEATKGLVVVFHDHDVTLADLPSGDGVVFTLRDPASRFASGFYSRYRKGNAGRDMEWSPGEERAFAEFRTPNELANALSSADIDIRRRAEAAMRSIGHIKRHYQSWLIDLDYLAARSPDIVYVARQETLNEDFDILKELLGLPSHLSLPQDRAGMNKTPSGFDVSLDDQARANLKTWYAHDYAILDLCERCFRNAWRHSTEEVSQERVSG